ncbi:MAG: pyridoxal-phosphate dependent enzyme [Polyangiaceae bacterium]|nr:pyridoxal-phosphate dependent enzyme [Polyangiaceae bacterium]
MRYAADLVAIRAAAARLAGSAHRTPVLTSQNLDELFGARLFFKCENLQRVGAFKFRGAFNAIARLDDARARAGVVTHSSGNHAQAIALAARLRGIPAHIVMPVTAPRVKRAAVEAYGGRVLECEPTLASRVESAARVVADTGAVLIPPYDHPDVIAGQGTVFLELHEQVPELDVVVVPVSGGGLISGIALACAELAPQTRVVGVEPDGADDARRSKLAGERVSHPAPHSIADGLLASLGELTWPVVRDHVERIVSVSEADIVRAMRLVWTRLKLVVEPSAAVSLAALGSPDFGVVAGRRVGVILSGGNVDLDSLPW